MPAYQHHLPLPKIRACMVNVRDTDPDRSQPPENFASAKFDGSKQP
jgi:hypothetical protein